MAKAWLRQISKLLVERRGSVSPILTLMLVPIIGALGMAGESTGWMFMNRAAQNAADAAVMAAAANGSTTAPTYSQEALATAAKYGFTNGTGNVTVTATNSAACPSPSTATNCYQVTVTKKEPIDLVSLVGYTGNTTVAGNPAVLITATAVASAVVPQIYCTIALAHGLSSGTSAFTIKGGPKINFDNCSVYSNASANCNGQGVPTIGTMTTVDNNPKNPCGGAQITGATPLSDPYSYLASNIPADKCSNSSGATLSTTDLSSYTATKPYVVCGNLTINANTSVTTASTGSVIVIEGGNLVLTGNLTAANGNPLTIIFSGAAGASAGFVTGGGTLDFGAPTTGTWQGIALYQDPALVAQTTVNYAGNAPTFNITGVIYGPYMNLDITGAVNKETNGLSCMVLVVNTVQSNGTGYIFSSSPYAQCYQAGVNLAFVPNTVQVRQALVQ